ncbi:MAG: FUSC family protein [Thermodesulfobacteriota bacterium]
MFKSHIFRSVVENFIVAVVAYFLGYYFTAMFHVGTAEVGGLWSVISGVFVMSEKESLTIRSARMRIKASFLGCLIAGLYLYFFSFSVLGFAIAIALGVFVCHALRIPDHIKTTSITISVVVIISAVVQDIGPVANAGLRFGESVIGSLVAVGVGLLGMYVFKVNKK